MNELNTSEERLRAEVEDLKQQLQQQKQELAARGSASTSFLDSAASASSRFWRGKYP